MGALDKRSRPARAVAGINTSMLASLGTAVPLFPSSPLKLVLLSMLFHLTYLGAMFDTYFHSPIIPIDVHHTLPGQPLADRVVLVVADGLRADLLYTPHAFDHLKTSDHAENLTLPEDGVVAPHLRSIIEERGSFGLSWTRVPTESRPGHVAIIAGIWEDPSAVFKGWKHNPVSFDSVFNHSSTTFSFGSPDILPIFGDPPLPSSSNSKPCLLANTAKNPESDHAEFFCSGPEDDPLDTDRRILMWMYNPDAEDFTSDTTQLDYFVLEKVKGLFEEARSDKQLNRRLRQPNTFFFLHLLGLDSSGHGWGPHSAEYMRNIQVVDSIVKEVEVLFQDFYGSANDRTAFLFTADHGMSNIGNHGDGHPDCTRTPYITWGSGLRKPEPESFLAPSHDETSKPWLLSHLRRRDIEQVDLNALMNSLSGREWSANSVGVLPTDLLSPDENFARPSQLAVTNAKALLHHVKVKHDLKARHRLRVKPYPQLPDLGLSDLSRAEAAIRAEDYTLAEAIAKNLTATATLGLEYYDSYDRAFLQGVISIGYISWAIFVLCYCKVHYSAGVSDKIPTRSLIDLFGAIAWSGFAVLSVYQRTPWHLAYVSFPIYAIRGVTTTWAALPREERLWVVRPKFAVHVVLMMGSVIILVAVFGAMPFYVYYLSSSEKEQPFEAHRSRTSMALFAIVSVIASLFMTLPVERSEDLGLLLVGSSLFLLADQVMETSMSPSVGRPLHTLDLQKVGATLLCASAIITAQELRSKNGLTFLARVTNWGLFSYAILSVSWELAFLFVFLALVISWIKVEIDLQLSESQTSQLNLSDGWRALLFIALIHCGFFGTGNVASISSFYLAPVYRLQAVFDPVVMSILLMFKILIPFLVLGEAFAYITKKRGTPKYAPILLMLSLTEPMCLALFLQIRTSGSWLEIGSSISHFAIVTLLVAFSLGVYVIGSYLMENAL